MEIRGRTLYGATMKWGRMGKNDLKIGPEKARLECIRMYISTFDLTRA
jgi:hypothetical protein